MCGIAGIIGRTDAAVLDGMLQRIRRRGPDDRGMMLEDGITLGHNRLSIIDVNERGRQPLSNEDGKVWLVFNGEIYNYKELRASLKETHTFRTETDSEVLVHLYEEKGPDMVHDLDGMFAFLLYDARIGRVFMARDPLGIKPLYYLRDERGHTLFASEIKALTPYGATVCEFPNGTWYQSGHGKETFWSLPKRGTQITDEHEAIDLIIRHLEQAVQKRLVADVPLGVFLSGGLDSSLISSITKRMVGGRLKSFATGMVGCADLTYARAVADYLETEHHEVAFSRADLIRALPEVIYNLESFDPALVRSAIPTYFVSRLARQHVTVVLSGEGADELFAGYHYLKEYSGRPDDLDAELRSITAGLHNTNLQRVDRQTMAVGLEGRVPFLDKALVAAAFRIHPHLKLRKDGVRAKEMGQSSPWVEKWILRRAAEKYLPTDVVWRTKAKFAVGTGTGEVLEAYAGEQISDADYKRERMLPNGEIIASKEELLYWRIFRESFGSDHIIAHMGRSRSLNEGTRYGASTKGA